MFQEADAVDDDDDDVKAKLAEMDTEYNGLERQHSPHEHPQATAFLPPLEAEYLEGKFKFDALQSSTWLLLPCCRCVSAS